MAIVQIPTKTDSSILGGLTSIGGGGVSTGSEILQFFSELRQFLQVPIVDTLIRQKMGIQNDASTGVLKTDGTINLKAQQTENKGGEKIDVKTPEEIVIEQLATPEGRKSLAGGITNIIQITGDVKLSEVIELLTKEDKKK